MSELNPRIFQHWIHSQEEDKMGELVYRPKGFKFPPARGRDGFEIKADGEFISYEIGPDDRPRKIIGRWRKEGDNRIIAEFEGGVRDPITLDIVGVDDRTLTVKKS